MPRHERRYRSRFRQESNEKEEENFTLSNYERKPINFSRRMVIWAPIVGAFLAIWYYVHNYLIGG